MDAEVRERLEHLRAQLRAECISWGELHELQSLAEHIEPGDVELLEAAGVPEFDDTSTERKPMDNAQRAGYGARAVENGTPDFGQNGDDPDGVRTDLVDTLANLMHYAAAADIDFEDACESARDHFVAEQLGRDL